MSLFYAADFADQLENKIIPALEAGYVVLADRYIYTLIARNNVSGIERRWSRSLFGFAMVPDLIFYLDVKPEELVHRVFQKNSILDYYESGMDIGLSDDMYKSFLIYQGKMAEGVREDEEALRAPVHRREPAHRTGGRRPPVAHRQLPQPGEMKATQVTPAQVARAFNQDVEAVDAHLKKFLGYTRPSQHPGPEEGTARRLSTPTRSFRSGSGETTARQEVRERLYEAREGTRARSETWTR